MEGDEQVCFIFYLTHTCCSRQVPAVDGTHLTVLLKGMLLCLNSKDANNNIVTLAFSLAPQENSDNWIWFFSLAKSDFGDFHVVFADGDKVSIKFLTV